MVLSPKYHCEIAGEGVEYDWGLIKKAYRNIPLEKKNTRDKFNQCFKQAVQSVSTETTRLFIAKSRRYMLAYKNIQNKDITYASIEKFVKKVKTHRSVEHSDVAFLNKIWKESI